MFLNKQYLISFGTLCWHIFHRHTPALWAAFLRLTGSRGICGRSYLASSSSHSALFTKSLCWFGLHVALTAWAPPYPWLLCCPAAVIERLGSLCSVLLLFGWSGVLEWVSNSTVCHANETLLHSALTLRLSCLNEDGLEVLLRRLP